MTDHAEAKSRVALTSIAMSALLTVGKLVAGLLSGSLALLSEAAHSLLDTGATILTYFAVRAADKPADDEHHYGHAKIESVAALAETAMLGALALYVTVEALRRIFSVGPTVEASPLAFAVLIAALVIDAFRWRALDKIARRTKSDALAADALHFSSDFVASLCVLIGLAFTAFGYPRADAFAALGVAAFIAIAGWRLGAKTVATLTDTAPKGLAEKVAAVVDAVPGVARVESVRLRPAGPEVIGEVGLVISRTLPFDRVSEITAAVTAALSREAPEVSATITANPVALDDESVLERVIVIAGARDCAVHHVTVQNVDGRRCVSLDLEVDGRMTLRKAHDVATALEAAIRDEIDPALEVDTHIEPMQTHELSGRDAGEETSARILAALETAAAGGKVFDIHKLRVRETAAGLVVNYHCRLDPALPIAEVHESVDQVDRRLRRAVAGVIRVVGHAEPPRP